MSEFGKLKLKDVKAGDRIVVDGGFTCIKGGTVVELYPDEDGHLCFKCRKGDHGLAGQIGGGGQLIGLARAQVAA